jgi:hypothetical protein
VDVAKKSERQRHEDQAAAAGGGAVHGPYWLRAHRDWRFWAVVLVMLVAMAVYVATMNLGLRPHGLGRPVLGVLAN